MTGTFPSPPSVRSMAHHDGLRSSLGLVLLLLIGGLGLPGLAGCGTDDATRTDGRSDSLRQPTTPIETTQASDRTASPRPTSDPRIRNLPRGDDAQGRVGQRTGAQRSARVLAEVQSVGSIPYDSETLPLVSPDGRYVATQAGIRPPWDAVIATRDARLSQGCRIEIHRVPDRPGAASTFVAALPEPAVLGRSTAGDGFLVEAPRPNGARWIGIASWETGAIDWIVQDEFVNAFASLGPDGRLAWSRRAVDHEEFDLVVYDGGNEFEIAAEEGDSWLMPTWSGVKNGLFVTLLNQDALLAVHMDASGERRAIETMDFVPLAREGATVSTAYQSFVTAWTALGLALPPSDELTFYHPGRRRAVLWRPPSAPVLLDDRSVAAVVDPADDRFVFVSTSRDLLRYDLREEFATSPLIAGTQILRPTTDSQRPYLLLQPGNGEIGLTRMRLLER